MLARPIEPSDRDLRIHCFLPTAVSSELGWLVQADFEPSASREQLRQSGWNAWLMAEAGTALASAVRMSARTLGVPPWDLVPLDGEVRDPQQRIAYEAALPILRADAFVSTRRGWRRPGAATWGLYPEVMEVVRERDLQTATRREVSYVRDDVMGVVSATATSRAEMVLEELGAEPVGPTEVVQLFAADDEGFARMHRDASWWISALALMARYATEEERRALAQTRCIPVRGGDRVRPSPSVDADGYLVAFSRSDLTQDLREYLGASEVFLVETFLSRGSDGDRHKRRSPSQVQAVSAIATMLEADPFNVAPEAGPYHVVANLVVPRFNVLARSDQLTPAAIDRTWRMLEYVRQKWPTYVSEYRRRRNMRATDAAIATELGSRLFVVATVTERRERVRCLRPLTETYLSTELLGWEAMDVALAEQRDVPVIDAIHLKPLRVAIKRRGGRARAKPPSIVDFLRLLGAPVGPRVAERQWGQVTPRDIPWADWSTLPNGARGRVALGDDWDSADIAQLAARWPRLSPRAQARRGAALLRSIEADWSRLQPVATANALYFYSSWRMHSTAPASWIGRLRQITWLSSLAGSLERPTDLVMDTPANRLALGNALEGVLKWKAAESDAVTQLGVHPRPSVERVIETLVALRSADDELKTAEALAMAAGCYQALSDHLRETGQDTAETRKTIASRMRGGSGRGLIYAPPPSDVEGQRWWAPSRVVQSDEARWVGPYLGQLAGRYRGASALWDALGIRRDLTVAIAREIIERDLQRDADQGRAFEYYGRLVSFLELAQLPVGAEGPIPALTTAGWVQAAEAWWSGRDEVRDAFAVTVAWWQPGTRDPSSLRRAARFLNIREVQPARLGGPLAERWDIGELEPLELEAEARWQLAVRTWPHVLREERAPTEWRAIEELSESVESLRAAVTSRLSIHLAFSQNETVTRAWIEPRVAFRVRTSTLVGRSTADLFSAPAANALATLIESGQHAAGNTLALLFALAAHDPDELDRRAARYSVATYRHREFEFTPAELEELGVNDERRIAMTRKRKSGGGDQGKEERFVPLADPLRYGLISTAPAAPSGRRLETSPQGKLKPPATQEESAEQGDSGQSRSQPPARMGYANTDIEGAARPFIEQYELATRAATVVPQGSNVGADYVASDGRYVEVKAFSGDAPDSVELEPAEWRAAQHPEVADRYWVYVVEHLRDRLPPKITAVFNPVLDDATVKESTGKLRIRGWKNARTQQVGQFADRGATDG